MVPIFHLSLPVRDLDEGIDFYVRHFGGCLGRRADDWADIALFGAQLTLQHRPDDLTLPMPRSRHFGATLARADWDALIVRLDRVDCVEGPTEAFVGTDREQAKAMFADPSGNLIEVKAYRNPLHVLGPHHNSDNCFVAIATRSQR